MKTNIIKALWGEFSGEELKKFLLLSCGMFFIIGSFWPLKVLKDSIFINIIGARYQPTVKIASLVFVFVLVLFYSKIVSFLSREKIIYLLIALYGGCGLIFAYYFAHPTIGLTNEVASPDRLLGWIFYLFVEGG